MKDVQCYELFGGIAPKNHAFSFSFFLIPCLRRYVPHNSSMLACNQNSSDFFTETWIIICNQPAICRRILHVVELLILQTFSFFQCYLQWVFEYVCITYICCRYKTCHSLHMQSKFVAEIN